MKNNYSEYTKDKLIKMCQTKDEIICLLRKQMKESIENLTKKEYEMGLLEARIEELENQDTECSWY